MADFHGYDGVVLLSEDRANTAAFDVSALGVGVVDTTTVKCGTGLQTPGDVTAYAPDKCQVCATEEGSYAATANIGQVTDAGTPVYIKQTEALTEEEDPFAEGLDFTWAGLLEDAEAPSQVTGLHLDEAHATSLHLGWDAATDNVGVDHYELYQTTHGGGAPDAETTPTVDDITGTTYERTGLTPYTESDFYMRAIDAAGNKGAWSDVFSATTLTLFTDLYDRTDGEPGTDWTPGTYSVTENWAVHNNELHVTTSDSYAVYRCHATGMSVATDMTAELTVAHLVEAGAARGIIGLRSSANYDDRSAQDPAGKLDGYQAQVTNAGAAYIQRLDDGVSETVMNSNDALWAPEAGDVYKFSTIGTALVLSARHHDGEFVELLPANKQGGQSSTDAAYASGRAFVGAYGGAVAVEARFADFKVY